MKYFKNSCEIRITKEDLILLIEEILNRRVLQDSQVLGVGPQQVNDISLHPGNKYVARITVSAKANSNTGD